MTPLARKIPPAGRGAARGFLFLTLYHLLPFPWYMAVAAGLAPASFLLPVGWRASSVQISIHWPLPHF